MKRIGTKSGKKKQFWANFQSGTGTETERYRYRPSEPIGTGTDPRGTGIAQQNAIGTGTDQSGTGTDQSGTGTAVPKMPRLCSFCIFKSKFTHRLYRNLTK